MTLSAAFMALLGVGITFLPQELLAYVNSPSKGPVVLLIQLSGAFYLGFAVLNWMARGKLIGGIYSRPVGVANFLHFFIGAIALLKGIFLNDLKFQIATTAIIYTVFTIWFGFVVFGNPVKETSA
jgi:hypothetical protein